MFLSSKTKGKLVIGKNSQFNINRIIHNDSKKLDDGFCAVIFILSQSFFEQIEILQYFFSKKRAKRARAILLLLMKKHFSRLF